MTNQRDIPDFFECAACGHRIELNPYSLMYPSDDTEAERIHKVWNPRQPEFSFICSCGHFTVVSPEEPG